MIRCAYSPPMITVDVEIEIERPAGEVFGYVSDFSNNPVWQGGISEAEYLTESPLRVGSRYRQVATMGRRRIESVFEVVSLEAGASVTIATVESTFPIQVTRRVEVLGPTRTRVTAHVEGEPGGLARLTGPLVRRLVRRDIERDYQRLKRVLEQGERYGFER